MGEEESPQDEVTIELDVIKPEPISPDSLSDRENEEIEADAQLQAALMRKQTAEAHHAEITNQERLDNLKARKRYARCIFGLLCVWVAATMGTVWASALKSCEMQVPDAVLIALITGVSVNIIGLFAVVANYLFPKS